MSGRMDPLCVDASAFLAEVQPIRDAWEARHVLQQEDSFTRSCWNPGNGVRTNGPFLTMLSEHTGIHQRRLNGIFRGEFAQIPLGQADEILVALDRPDILTGLTVYKRARGIGRTNYVLTSLAA